MIENSVPAVLLDWHVLPSAVELLHVYLHQPQTWLLPSTVRQHITPGVHRQRVSVRRALVVVLADLRRCQDKTLVLNCPRS